MRVYFPTEASRLNREVSFNCPVLWVAQNKLKTRVQSSVQSDRRACIVLLKLNPTVHPGVRKHKIYLTHRKRKKIETDQINQSISLRFAISRQRIVNTGSDRNFNYVWRQLYAICYRTFQPFSRRNSMHDLFSLYDGDVMPTSRGKRLVRVQVPLDLSYGHLPGLCSE